MRGVKCTPRNGNCGIGHRIDVAFDEIRFFRLEDQVVAAERHDLRVDAAARHAAELVAVQAAARHDGFRVDLAFRRLQHRDAGAAHDARDLVAEVHVGAHLARVLAERARHQAPVDDAGDGREDRAHAARSTVRARAICAASSISRFSMPFAWPRAQRSSSRPSSDSSVATISLPTFLYSMPFASQYSHASLRPSTHSLRLERAGLVVDSRVDDAAVVARLVLAPDVFFLDVRDAQARVAKQQLARRGEADDASADYSDVVDHVDDDSRRFRARPL